MSLLAGYTFDEGAGSTAAEVAGGATITSVPGWAAGLHGSSMFIDLEAGPTIDPFAINTAFTIMFDVYIVGDGSQGWNMLMAGGNSTGLGTPQASGSGDFQWYHEAGDTGVVGNIPDGVWTNVALVADGTVHKVYLDGVLEGSIGNTVRSGTDPIAIGGIPSYDANFRMDNLRIYDEVLSDGAIASLAGTAVTADPNIPPVANAGSDQTSYTDQLVTLDGSASTDEDGTIEDYVWTQISGPVVVLTDDPSTPLATFTPTEADTYVFELQVTDDDSSTHTDQVTVTVQEPPAWGLYYSDGVTWHAL